MAIEIVDFPQLVDFHMLVYQAGYVSQHVELYTTQQSPQKGCGFLSLGNQQSLRCGFTDVSLVIVFFSHHYNHIADCVLCHSPASFFVASQASCNPDWC